MCFIQNSATSISNDKPLKLEDHFTYLSSNISSTESYINICTGKAWTAIDRLLSIWKFNLSDEIEIFPSCDYVSTISWLHHQDSNKVLSEKTRWKLHNNAACYSEQILEAAPHKMAAVRALASHLTNHSSKTNKTCQALLEKQECSHKSYSGLPPMKTQVLIKQQGLIFICFVQVPDAILKTCQEWWMIGMNGKRVKQICVITMNWW